MNKKIRYGILIAWLFVSLCSGKPVFAEGGVVTFGVDSDYPPFSYVVDGRAQGFENELLQLIFENGPYTMEFMYGYTWDAIYKAVKNSEMDVCGTLVRNPTRAKEVLFTKDAYTRYYGVFANADTTTLNTENLQGYRLGAVKGYYSEYIVRDELKAPNYEVFESYEAMLKALRNHRIEGFIEATEVVKYYIEKNALVGKVVLQKDGLYSVSVPFGVSKSRPDLQVFMDRRIDEIKASGEFEILYIRNFSAHSPSYYEAQRQRYMWIIVGIIAGIAGILLGLELYICRLKRRMIRAQGFSKAVVENATVAIVLCDKAGRFISLNPFALKVTGYQEQELAGELWRGRFFEEGNRESVEELLSLIRTPDVRYTKAITIKSKQGIQITLLFCSAVVSEDDESGPIVALFGTDITEISESKRLLQESHYVLEESRTELEEMNAELEETNALLQEEIGMREAVEEDLKLAKIEAESANVAKSYFLANMSHEIRTPLNGFMGMIQLLQTTELSEEQKEYLRISQASSEALLNVVNEILDYTKLEAGRMGLEETVFNLEELLRDMTAIFRPSALLKHVTFEISAHSDMPRFVEGDNFKIRQILSNLLGNAIKFTSQGSVKLFVRVSERMEDGEMKLAFEIRDTGIGIPEDKQSILFHRFSQVDGSITRRYGGTGLGLAIAKGLAELMRGDIRIESAAGEGSTVYFSCVVRAAAAQAEASGACEGDTQGVEKRETIKILLAEDDPTSRLLISSLSRKQGWELIVAENGQEALDFFKAQNFDIILMDCQMPVMDGYEATRRIRAMEGSGDHTPIVALTAHTLQGDAEKCTNAGMDGYMGKPVDIHVLLDVIRKHSQRRNFFS